MAQIQHRESQRFSVTVAGKEFVIETGKLAEQAGGAVTLRYGDTVIFCAATMAKNASPGVDFVPLTVEYEEKLYAAGRIPGSFFRREGRPAESAILTSRVIDRPLRPLFPKDLRNEVQVILMPFSHDQEHQVDMIGIVAASTALMISDVPWAGPVAGVRIGLIDGELVVNPTISEMENSTLDLRVAGTAEAINMVECGAQEVDEATMLKAFDLAHDTIKVLTQFQIEIREKIGKAKSQYEADTEDEALIADVTAQVYDQVRQIIAEKTDRDGRNEAIEAVRDELLAAWESRVAEMDADTARKTLKQVREALNGVVKKEVRRRIVEDGVRPDGRDYLTIRPLAAEVGLVPRVHGTGLFTRGQTQVLSLATLGTPGDAQELDGVSPEEDKRYLHHYNMPPYSTGEAYPMRGPKRREIGHGALAETALRYVIPDEDVFPYTIRVVSEVMSSNGSTSMASVCGSTLALMDAGVPIIAPVAGIAMGLIKEGDKVAVLTDIQGLEDHLGDMDFKVAGTRKGITALQMDIKITGVAGEVMKQALKQAYDARLEILEVMAQAISEPRSEMSMYAPRMTTVKVNVDKIGTVIGPGGKTVRGIQDRLGVKIDIKEDGTVFVSGPEGNMVQQAIDEIRGLTEEPEIGRIYTGKVTRIESYGAFVEFTPGREGMVHISQLADYRVEKVEDEVQLGDELMVMITDVDPSGKVRLSRQAVLEGWTPDEAKSRDAKISRGGSGGGDRRGGGDRGGNRGGGGDRRSGGGGGGNRGGGDRGGRR